MENLPDDSESLFPDDIVPEGPLRGTKIRIAGQTEVNLLETEIERVLDAVGHPEALVTDRSCLWDFPLGPEDEGCPTVAEIQATLGVEIHQSDRLVDVAWRMRNKS